MTQLTLFQVDTPHKKSKSEIAAEIERRWNDREVLAIKEAAIRESLLPSATFQKITPKTAQQISREVRGGLL